MGRGGRATPRTPTTSATSWSGATCSSTRSPTAPSPRSGAWYAYSAGRAPTSPRARPASATPSCRCSGPPAIAASLPAPLQLLLPRAARGGGLAVGGPLPPALAFECTDLVARLVAVRARIAALEAELVRVAQPLPAYARLRTLPGVGPTVAAILLAELGDITWYSQFSQLRKLAGLDIQWVATGQFTGTARISKAGRPLLRWALYQAALGAARTAAWRARREALIAKRRGDRHAFFKATVELAAKLLRLVWGVWRSGRPYDPARVDAGPAAGPAIALRAARTGRRGALPSGKGQAAIAKPSGCQAGRVPDTQDLYPRTRSSARR